MYFVLKLSKLCNLRCTYCYEYDELSLAGRMPIEDLDRFFAWLAEYQPPGGWPLLRFVFHGGEPLLLPHAYLEGVVAAQRRRLDPTGLRYSNSLQTNLTRLDNGTIELLDRLRIGLGVSLDVFGGERVAISGRDSQGRVLGNLQKLLDCGAAARLGVGVISVLHRGNLDRVVSVYEFCSTLGLTCRVLPVFSIAEPPARMAHLALEPEEVVEALRQLAEHWLSTGMAVCVYPLQNYLEAAIHRLLDKPARTYDPASGDWAYIINTNGDAYSNGEAYSPAGWMGNIFRQPLLDILRSPAHAESLAPRLERAQVCSACRHGSFCSRVSLIEALPSERAFSADGRLRCPLALPMIDFFCERLRANPDAARLLADARSQASPARDALLPMMHPHDDAQSASYA
jgi:uncharacterized protein